MNLLDRADEYVARLEKAVTIQTLTIAKQRAHGYDTVVAEALLKSIYDSLQLMNHYRRTLITERRYKVIP